MLLSSVDWTLCGGTGAVVLLIAANLLRDYGKVVAARLSAADVMQALPPS